MKTLMLMTFLSFNACATMDWSKADFTPMQKQGNAWSQEAEAQPQGRECKLYRKDMGGYRTDCE